MVVGFLRGSSYFITVSSCSNYIIHYIQFLLLFLYKWNENSVMELECLAIVKSIEHFGEYIDETNFNNFTDHKNLRYILDKQGVEESSLFFFFLVR